MKKVELLILPITVLMIVAIVAYARLSDREPVVPEVDVAESMPDFRNYTDVKAKKLDFFEYLLPMIRNANERVFSQRQRLKTIAAAIEAGESLTRADRKFVNEIGARHKVDVGDEIDAGDLAELLVRIDVVPASLILAQAANESAWGTSRFARTANNLFGIWCFSPGCGVTPRQRDEGLTHEVRRFDTVADGVHYYLRMINSNRAYAPLRKKRAELRAAGEPVTGMALAEGLLRYSERGEAYVDEIQAMIRYNELGEYNLARVDTPDNRG